MTGMKGDRRSWGNSTERKYEGRLGRKKWRGNLAARLAWLTKRGHV